MRLNWLFLRLAILSAIVLLGAGCSGINASQSVSPLSFFLPSLVQTKPKPEKFPTTISQATTPQHLAHAD